MKGSLRAPRFADVASLARCLRVVSVTCLTVLVASQAVEGQRRGGGAEGGADDGMWRMYEGVVLASVTAGCFSVRHQATWSADSLSYPTRFALTAEEFHGLGYHSVGTFATDMPVLVEGRVSPIWRPMTLDSMYLDPDPAPDLGPSYHAILVTVGDGEFVLETFRADNVPRPGDNPRWGRLVGRAYGTRVACDEGEGGRAPAPE